MLDRHVMNIFIGVSTDSVYSHLAWATQARKQGGLGPDLQLPLIADRNQQISRDYNVLIEEEGIALRGLFIIDPKGVLRQITVNDLPVGRSVDETIRLIKAFQFTVRKPYSRFRQFAHPLIRRSTAKSALPTGTRAARPSRLIPRLLLSTSRLPMAAANPKLRKAWMVRGSALALINSIRLICASYLFSPLSDIGPQFTQ